MAGELLELKKDTAASLYIIPCTFKELAERDFLRNKSHYGIQIMVDILLRDHWVYKKGEKLCVYKGIAESKLKDYEL